MFLKRRRFERKVGIEKYHKLFLISGEGRKTEQQYFNMLKKIVPLQYLKIRYVSANKSAPKYILKRIKEHIKQHNLKDNFEAWIVVDKDSWKDEQLKELVTWSQEKEFYGFALSNPTFEYWLLLHFEEGGKVNNQNECIQRLKIYFPNYDKSVSDRRININKIMEAVGRAKLKDNPPCNEWPRRCGTTTVYKLVEKIIKSQI